MSTDHLPLETRMFIFYKVNELVLQFFAHWQDAAFTPHDLDERIKCFLPRVIDSKERSQFNLVMMEYMAPLHNGHTSYWDTEIIKSTQGLGIELYYAQGEWVVKSSAHEHIVPGDVITGVNTRTMEEWFVKTSEYLCLKNEMAKRTLFPMYLPFLLSDKTVQLEWRNRAEELCSTTITRTFPLVEQNGAVETEGHWLTEAEVAYIKIPSFTEPRFEEHALRFVEKFRQSSAIIVDIRENSGGSTPQSLVKALMNQSWRWGMSSSPLQVGILQHQRNFENSQLLWSPPINTPVEEAYQGKLIIIIDRLTGSAAEDFTMPFKDNGRATLVGECTFGSTGQPIYYEFENDITLRVSTKRDYMPDGSIFEGVGITPDVLISKTRQDFYLNRDRAITKAIECARL